MTFMGRTRAVTTMLFKDLERILFVVSIIVQCIFFIYYGYSIYASINKVLFLVIYSLLLVLAIIGFVNYLVTRKNKEKKSKRFNKFLRISKYVFNGTMLVVNIIDMVQNEYSDLSKIFLIISGVLLFIQIIIEFILVFVERYIELYTVSIKMDLDFIQKIEKLKQVKGNIFEVLDAPLEAIVNKLEGKVPEEPELTETEKYVNELGEELEEELKEKKKKKKKEKVERIKRKSTENAEAQKKEIKEHFDIIINKIFKRKKKVK